MGRGLQNLCVYNMVQEGVRVCINLGVIAWVKVEWEWRHAQAMYGSNVDGNWTRKPVRKNSFPNGWSIFMCLETAVQ